MQMALWNTTVKKKTLLDAFSTAAVSKTRVKRTKPRSRNEHIIYDSIILGSFSNVTKYTRMREDCSLSVSSL